MDNAEFIIGQRSYVVEALQPQLEAINRRISKEIVAEMEREAEILRIWKFRDVNKMPITIEGRKIELPLSYVGN